MVGIEGRGWLSCAESVLCPFTRKRAVRVKVVIVAAMIISIYVLLAVVYRFQRLPAAALSLNTNELETRFCSLAKNIAMYVPRKSD